MYSQLFFLLHFLDCSGRFCCDPSISNFLTWFNFFLPAAGVWREALAIRILWQVHLSTRPRQFCRCSSRKPEKSKKKNVLILKLWKWCRKMVKLILEVTVWNCFSIIKSPETTMGWCAMKISKIIWGSISNKFSNLKVS